VDEILTVIEALTTLITLVGPAAGLLFLVIFFLLRQRRHATNGPQVSEPWRVTMDARLNSVGERVTRLEIIQQDRWDLTRDYLIQKIKQPTHARMDVLLDRLSSGQLTTVEDLSALHQELEERLDEPEPTPGYHLTCVYILSFVREVRRAVERQASDAT
jgi:hypothetical protein